MINWQLEKDTTIMDALGLIPTKFRLRTFVYVNENGVIFSKFMGEVGSNTNL